MYFPKKSGFSRFCRKSRILVGSPKNCGINPDCPVSTLVPNTNTNFIFPYINQIVPNQRARSMPNWYFIEFFFKGSIIDKLLIVQSFVHHISITINQLARAEIRFSGRSAIFPSIILSGACAIGIAEVFERCRHIQRKIH